MVYSTCTFNPGENEEIVRYALDNFPLELVPQEVYLGDKGLQNSSLAPSEADLVQRFDPRKNMHGFFIAKFCKVSSIRKQ